jgi:hypothetical protein
VTAAAIRASSIGPEGIAARAVVGAFLIVLELLWRNPKWWDPFVAIAGAALITTFMARRAARNPAPLDATGPVAHALSVLVAIPLLLLPVTSGGALLFYGGSMLLAAARRSCGCEVTVVSNAVLGRSDQLGCALFAPMDALEGVRGTAGNEARADG